MTLTKPSRPAGNQPTLDDIKKWADDTLHKIEKWLMDTLNYLLNQMFALRHTVAGMRGSIVMILFITFALFFILNSRPFDNWLLLLGNFFDALTGNLPEGLTPSTAYLDLMGAIFFNPGVWARLIVLYAPFMLMHRITSIYLADVFEKDEDVARKFILQAAFAGEYSTIRIREGKIVDADQNSPIVQIGGPGYVLVELDSAALFERPDGTPHVIPPTGGERRSRKVVDGFERIRQAADLRDIKGTHEMRVRSRDGILVDAKDIQYTYSIYRGENAVKTLKTPYPFDENALISLVYKAPRPAKVNTTPPKPDWDAALPGKLGGSIQTELGGFVNKRGLSEFLSSTGEPERDALRNFEDKLDKDGQQLSGRNGSRPQDDSAKAPPFASRASITAMFYADSFKKSLAGKGLQLSWIGVGTWVTPAKIIPSNHLEAWKLSRENAQRNSPDQLKRLREDAHMQESMRLIQTMPIGKFYTDLKQEDDAVVVEVLIADYYERLQSALELFERDGQDLPPNLLKALQVLNNVRGTSHRWINDSEDDDNNNDDGDDSSDRGGSGGAPVYA